jgi:hypothetical protein
MTSAIGRGGVADRGGYARRMPSSRPALVVAATALALGLTACGSGDQGAEPAAPPSSASSVEQSAEGSEQQYPDIRSVDIQRADDGTYTLDVTVSSPYDSPERYADGWRVLDPDGNELGSHMLAHDHAGEQPFTRTQSGLEIPDAVTEVTVEGRDQANGYGGETVTVQVPSS